MRKTKKLFSTIALIGLLFPLGKILTSCFFTYDLVVFNWGEYMDEEVRYAFEDTYNVRIKYLTFDSNENMISKIEAGAKYDVVFPSDYTVEEMAKKDMIEKLDPTKFEYYKGEESITPILRDAMEKAKETGVCTLKDSGLQVDCTLEEYNQNRDKYTSREEGFDYLEYSIPYTFGQTGILYDKNKVSKEELETLGYDVLKQDKNIDGTKRRVVVYDAGKDVLSMAMLQTGHNFVHEDPQAISDSTAWLQDLVNKKKGYFAYKADEILDDMPNGVYDVAFTYSGDAIYCISETLDDNDESRLDFYIPKAKENCPVRTNIYCDNMVIMKDSQNKDLAYKFIDFMSSHDAAYLNTVYTGYTSPINSVYKSG